MNNDDLKSHTVLIEGASGCLFQPMSKEYTYILTAKHVFEKEILDNGRPNYWTKTEGEKITIIRFVKVNENEWKEVGIDNIVFKPNISYFPHEKADIAIIKIDYIEGYDNIFVQDDCENETGYFLCGCPKAWYGNDQGEKYTTQTIDRFGVSGNYCLCAHLPVALSKNNIEGMSGGGLMKSQKSHISIIGIQSKMASELFPAGQIGFVPMNYFNEIVNYPENKGKLELFHPPYMKSFEFLKDKAFNIHAGINDNNIIAARNFLKKKASEVIKSEITPLFIKEYFKERLILNAQRSSNLENIIIYITWLEFLTIVNIIKSKTHDKNDLKEVFNQIRLIYKDTVEKEDWQSSDFLRECMNYNYSELCDSGTVLIKTNALPTSEQEEYYWIKKRSLIPDIANLRKEVENGGFCIDDGMKDRPEFVFDRFDFIHFEYLKQYVLVRNNKDFSGVKTDQELHDKLKKEYGKLFATRNNPKGLRRFVRGFGF